MTCALCLQQVQTTTGFSVPAEPVAPTAQGRFDPKRLEVRAVAKPDSAGDIPLRRSSAAPCMDSNNPTGSKSAPLCRLI
jgi:hypothetical protein